MTRQAGLPVMARRAGLPGAWQQKINERSSGNLRRGSLDALDKATQRLAHVPLYQCIEVLDDKGADYFVKE